MDERYFMTVDWCDQERRGIFCDDKGRGLSSDEPLMKEEMRKFLGPFWMFLEPVSEQMTVEEVSKYRTWTPLDEYSGVYGILRKEGV